MSHFHVPRDEGAFSRQPIDHIAAYEYGIALLKKAGFRLHTVSQKSESVYYDHPQRPGVLLRVSMHRLKRSIGHSNTIVTAVFGRKGNWTEFAAYCQIRQAIGTYMLIDVPPSEYQGKRGTWEKRNGKIDGSCRTSETQRTAEAG